MLDVSGIDGLLAKGPGQVAEWLDLVAEAMVTDIKLSFGTSPAGKTHTSGKGGGIKHVASQPGYPPNVDLGALRASMKWRRISLLRRQIEDGVEYGIHLEDGVGMGPRPFVRPIFDQWRREIGNHARQHLNLRP